MILREARLASNVWAIALLAGAVAAAVQSWWIPIDADVSWLITVCERLLGGDRLYVDVLEVNPPASVWLYLPLVWIAQQIGARPEAVVAAAFIAGGLASVLATAKLAARLECGAATPWVVAIIAFCVLVLPMGLFAQREHAALLLALPALTVLALVGAGKVPGRAIMLVAGLAAGLIVVLKPHFLFAMLLPALWATWRRRALKPLLPALAAALAVIILYSIAVIALANAYFDLLPRIALTYLRMHDDIGQLLTGGIVLFPALCAALAAFLRPPKIPALTMAWGLGAIGFAIAGLLQAKNYPNHWLAGAILADLALVVLLALPGIDRDRRRLAALALAVIMALQLWKTASVHPDPRVAAKIRRVAPPRPMIIALSSNLETGHPVTRNVDGRWAGSRPALFTAAGARFVGLHDPAVAAAYRADLRSFANDVQRESPDVVVVSVPEKPWLMQSPVIAGAMASYAPAARIGETELWLRR